MAKNVLTASLTIEFITESELDSGILQAEIDARPDGMNGGVTTFYPGDNPGILLFKSPGFTRVERLSTEGSLVSHGTGNMKVREFITFSNSTSASTTKPISGGLDILQVKGQGPVDMKVVGNSVTSSKAIVAVLEVEYTTSFSEYRLSGASGRAPVLVFFQGFVST